ncbi:zinc carboxypeptidase-like [Thrips palmi]|uniref:Zinc carboxypeptidase-like n=1 Tax=Thrips palmi TaxID=161013 RepID=A0A6P8Y0D5_THRPL|nr:zinc carboxypeptidase-like [Thrips palmi]
MAAVHRGWGGRVPLLLVVAVVAVRQAVGRQAAVVAFKDHKVLRIVPATDKQLQSLRQYLGANPTLDVWLDPTVPGSPVDVHVSPADAVAFREYLGRQELTHKDMIPDLGRVVDEEQRQMLDAKRSNPEFGWDNYHTLEEIYKWMQSLVRKYPDEVTLVDGGRSYEGRTILGVKIKAVEEDAPVAFIEAGIHAREWITPATATFMINEILTRSDEEFRSAVRAYEWHIFPSTNPDGYYYTHNGNRLWRKSRSKFNYICYGADLNRNWPFHWGETGSSSSPCSDVYAGVRAGSEAETKALRHYVDALMEKPNPLRVYISLHSYSQLLMFPWGYTLNLAADHADLDAVAQAAAQAASKRYGTKFRHGPIARTIYAASGSTIDYTYEKGVKFPFVYELRDTGEHGFLLPKDQIRPAAEEAVDSMAVIAAEVLKRK